MSSSHPIPGKTALSVSLSAFCLLCALALPLPAQEEGSTSNSSGKEPTLTETIQVTATRAPEDVEPVPATVTVISGEELLARGATDLASALSLVGGVAVAPGGDTGPAGSVPELWGLREFDAFLLVVDGVPWGGAFNPALTTLDLHGIDRIEILRGPAPVMYGATSFVGVIHVLHRAAGATGRRAEISGGSYGSGSAAVWTPLPAAGGFAQSLAADVERQGFKDDRTQFDRGHLLYRASRQAGAGNLRFDLDAHFLRQDPASPTPRQGRVLSPLVPLDSNHNPRGSHVDDDRYHLVGGYDRALGNGSWSTTLALTHTQRDSLRGFLTEIAETDPNANGFRQDLKLDDLYFDSHVVLNPAGSLRVVAGFDHLYGKAKAESEDFDYFVHLNGTGAPSGSSIEGAGFFDMDDERNFSGLYAQLEWTPAPRWRFDLGARLNRTVEDRQASARELGEEEGDPGEEEEGRDSRHTTRGSGVVGVSWLAWQGEGDAGLWLFADARNTFKPAALDFGPEAEPDILEPETARSYEVGAKGRSAGGRLDWELSGFQMDFRNLVLPSTTPDGLPTLINAGKERFRGGELEARWRLRQDLLWRLAYASHDARFGDFVRDFDGVSTQLRGNRLELSARQLASTGLIYAPDRGWFGSALASYVGSRFLNQRNTALAPSYTVWSAGMGYRFPAWDVRLDGENLTDERDPVAESELGDAQYYRQPARSFRLSLGVRF